MTNISPIQIATLLLALVSTSAFAPPTPNNNAARRRQRPTAPLSAVKFDKSAEKWYTDLPEEQSGSSYGPIGTLYRAGPKPFIARITNGDTYDQAVLKYMAQDGCDRREAQGNMDAFLENPQDWAYQKTCESNGAYKKDYANANMGKKQVALTTVWAGIAIFFIGDLVYKLINGEIMADSFHRTMELLGVEQ